MSPDLPHASSLIGGKTPPNPLTILVKYLTDPAKPSRFRPCRVEVDGVDAQLLHVSTEGAGSVCLRSATSGIPDAGAYAQLCGECAPLMVQGAGAVPSSMLESITTVSPQTAQDLGD